MLIVFILIVALVIGCVVGVIGVHRTKAGTKSMKIISHTLTSDIDRNFWEVKPPFGLNKSTIIHLTTGLGLDLALWLNVYGRIRRLVGSRPSLECLFLSLIHI